MKTKRNKQPRRQKSDPEPGTHEMAITGGGLSDEDMMHSRGSDMPEQELEIEGTMSDSVKRKRESIEEGSMDDERVA